MSDAGVEAALNIINNWSGGNYYKDKRPPFVLMGLSWDDLAIAIAAHTEAAVAEAVQERDELAECRVREAETWERVKQLEHAEVPQLKQEIARLREQSGYTWGYARGLAEGEIDRQERLAEQDEAITELNQMAAADRQEIADANEACARTFALAQTMRDGLATAEAVITQQAEEIARLRAVLNLCMDALERMGEMSAQGKLDSDVWYACVKAREALRREK